MIVGSGKHIRKKDGYGSVREIGGKKIQAHRLSYQIHYGFIPEGIFVLHSCGNASCTNPKHIYLGNQKQNMNDMIKHGTSTKGEKNRHAKLTEKDVYQIRLLYNSKKYSQKQIANMYNVSHSNISSITLNKSWK